MDGGFTLVTGATGLVGHNVVRALVDRGQPARVLVRQQSDPRPLEGLPIDVVYGDVRDAHAVDRACRGVRSVVHCAGYVHIGWTELDQHRAINVEGTRIVASAARRAGARMVHVSSCDAIESGTKVRPSNEETPANGHVPVPYVITKREAERVVLGYVAEGLDALIVNPAMMFGPWDWKPSSGRMLLDISSGWALFAPRGWCSLCDVRDVTEAILVALERGQTGKRYILAGEMMSWLEAWRLFASEIGTTRPLCRAGPIFLKTLGWGGDLWARVARHEPAVNSGAIALAKVLRNYSSARAAQELGYRTRPLEETVRDAWRWFQQYGYA